MSLLEESLWNSKININGWIRGSAGSQDVMEPATGNVLGRVGLASAEDVLRAASTAAKAQVLWAAKKPEERAAVLRKAGDLWELHAEEINVWLVREAGSIGA
ncbi:aldehyde dehydrogenase family protein, partial [Arthrobacter sp.]|uniref:aldehyde dehydrogenase family protein n=1 Tax=Arthrobacter sp. TaxID=1667 RepID=UPI0026E0741F